MARLRGVRGNGVSATRRRGKRFAMRGRASPRFDASSDRARIAQATGMLMELFELDALQALALLYVVSSTKLRRTSSAARELVERWPAAA